MWKKFGIVFSGLLIVLVVVACGGAKYADIKAVMEKIVEANDIMVTSLDKANDAKAVSSAINIYTESIKAEQASFQGMMKKYPELKEAKDPPKELKESVDKLNSMGERLLTAMTKLQTYAEDKDVKAAVKKMAELQLQ